MAKMPGRRERRSGGARMKSCVSLKQTVNLLVEACTAVAQSRVLSRWNLPQKSKCQKRQDYE
jgi:hypothetical protein